MALFTESQRVQRRGDRLRGEGPFKREDRYVDGQVNDRGNEAGSRNAKTVPSRTRSASRERVRTILEDMDQRPERVSIMIEDDGVGFDTLRRADDSA
jgi:hypothetical protein